MAVRVAEAGPSVFVSEGNRAYSSHPSSHQLGLLGSKGE